jgi:DNA polymerase IV
MIMHIDMDAFFASIEQAINPGLKGKPLIVGSREDKMRTIVCASSYEAKAFGITAGMSTIEALTRCPHAAFVPADQGKYIWTSEEIYGMLKKYGLPMNYASIDEFQLDLGDMDDPTALAREIQTEIYSRFNITASAGIAKNWLLAKLASKLNKPNGIALITDQNMERVFAKVPAKKICGVGPRTAEILETQGVRTCLDLYRKDAHFLKEHLGQAGIELYLGMRTEERFEAAESPEKPKSVGHSYTLPRATQNMVFIKAWVLLLSDMVGQRLRQKGLVSKSVHVWLNGPEIGSFSAQMSFTQATNDHYEIYTRALKIMDRKAPKTPKIRALGVTCASLEEIRYQPLLEEEKRRDTVIKAIDRINGKYGDNTIFPAAVVIAKKMD